MKKILVLLAAAVLSLGAANTANAQKLSDNFCTIGLHTGAYTGDLGLGLNLDFNAGNWRGRLLLDGANLFDEAPTYFAPAVDFHYVINLVAGLDIYPIVGVNGYISTAKGDAFNLGLDLGGGLQYRFTDKFSLFAEGKYQYMIINPGKHYQGIFGFAYAL